MGALCGYVKGKPKDSPHFGGFLHLQVETHQSFSWSPIVDRYAVVSRNGHPFGCFLSSVEPPSERDPSQFFQNTPTCTCRIPRMAGLAGERGHADRAAGLHGSRCRASQREMLKPKASMWACLRRLTPKLGSVLLCCLKSHPRQIQRTHVKVVSTRVVCCFGWFSLSTRTS